jgi:PKD repeat protein
VSNAGGSDSTTRTITVNPAGGGGQPIAPSDDTYADAGEPTAIKGNASDLRVRTGSRVLHTYLKFTVSGAGAVDGATLRLFVTEASVDGGSLYLVPTNTWSEASLNWSNKPEPSGTPIDTLGAVAANTWVELDVSTVVTGDGTYSFALINASNDVARYSSSEAATGDPELVLSAP